MSLDRVIYRRNIALKQIVPLLRNSIKVLPKNEHIAENDDQAPNRDCDTVTTPPYHIHFTAHLLTVRIKLNNGKLWFRFWNYFSSLPSSMDLVISYWPTWYGPQFWFEDASYKWTSIVHTRGSPKYNKMAVTEISHVFEYFHYCQNASSSFSLCCTLWLMNRMWSKLRYFGISTSHWI